MAKPYDAAGGTDLPAVMWSLLTQTVRAHLPDSLDRDLATTYCSDALAFARTRPGPGAGALARNAAALLLDAGCPRLDEVVRRELAVACELIAVGALGRSTDR